MGCVNAFLIRSPEAVLASYAQKRRGPTSRSTRSACRRSSSCSSAPPTGLAARRRSSKDTTCSPIRRRCLSALCAALRHRLRSGDARLAAGPARERRRLGAGLVRRGRALDRLCARRAPRPDSTTLPDSLEADRRGGAPALRAAGAPSSLRRPRAERLALTKSSAIEGRQGVRSTLDGPKGPSHQDSDAHARAALSRDQPRPGSMGSAGDSLVCARLYRRADRRLGADPPARRPTALWGGAARPSADSIDDLLVYCALGVVIGGRLGNVLFYDPGLLFRPSARDLRSLARRHGLPRRPDRRGARRRRCSRAATRRRC